MPTAVVLSGGGPLAVAWECGLAVGLARVGIVLTAADFLLGTSAGAIVGARLAAGHEAEVLFEAILDERNGVPPTAAMPAYPHAAVMKLPELFALSQSGAAGCAEVGSHALAASTVESESAYIDRMKSAIGVDTWPSHPIGLVAIDTADGVPRVLSSESGITIAAAVAASCSVPGLSPPVTIDGRRYMDGGMRSTANADLAAGFESILALCFHPPGEAGQRIRARACAQAKELERAGARVHLVFPDEASVGAERKLTQGAAGKVTHLVGLKV